MSILFSQHYSSCTSVQAELTAQGPYPLRDLVAERLVGSEISNMLDISQWSSRRPATASPNK